MNIQRLAELGLAGPQAEQDRRLGLTEDLQGSLVHDAQIARVTGLVNEGMPLQYAAEAMGVPVEEYELAIDALKSVEAVDADTHTA